MKQYIHPDFIILSDGWRCYRGCEEIFNEHYVVNHSIESKDKQIGTYKNTIGGNWSAIKSQIPKRIRTGMLIDVYHVRFMVKRNEEGDIYKDLIRHLF
ncbi:hypothetical protein H311_00432 [Anncaliia algerae PRA109]|nr:hypothetical protein H311_00432 [Anncaliia algerae PRA109]